MITTLIKSYDRLVETLVAYTTPVILLAMRLLVAEAFFRAGQTKIANWGSTLYLFEEEYSVPLLPYELAAYLATATELIIPVLLVFGFLARPAAAVSSCAGGARTALRRRRRAPTPPGSHRRSGTT